MTDRAGGTSVLLYTPAGVTCSDDGYDGDEVICNLKVITHILRIGT